MEYTFKEKNTDKIVRVDLRISEYDAYKASHPNLERYFETAPNFIMEAKSLNSRMSKGWKEVLSKIGEKNTASPLAEEHRKNKTIKEVKTKEVIKKYVKKAVKERNKKR